MHHSEILLFVLALAGVGCLSGFLAGLLGVGGGIVVVPALYYVFGLLDIDSAVRAHLAVGTSLATIVPTSIMSLTAHHRRGAIDIGLLRSWAPWVGVGVLIGVALAGVLRGEVLTAIFGVVGLLVAGHMGFSNEGLAVRDGLPGPPVKQMIPVLIGGVSTLMGIGGGTLTVPALSLCKYPVRRAVGTASAIGLVIAVPGALGFIWNGWGMPQLPPWSLGFLSLPGFLAIVPSSMLFAPIGARTAHAIPMQMLRRAFALFLALTAARMLQTAVT